MKGTKKEDYPIGARVRIKGWTKAHGTAEVIGYTPQKIVFWFESGAEVRQYPKPHLLELVDEPA